MSELVGTHAKFAVATLYLNRPSKDYMQEQFCTVVSIHVHRGQVFWEGMYITMHFVLSVKKRECVAMVVHRRSTQVIKVVSLVKSKTDNVVTLECIVTSYVIVVRCSLI